MIMDKIEHIGIAVKDLESANEVYTKLFGEPPYKNETVESEGVSTSFFKIGESKIELLEATNPESAIAKFIDKKGEGIHHIAFAVPNATEALKTAEERGVRLIDKVSRKGAEGLNIGFLHPKSTLGVLTELCSKEK